MTVTQGSQLGADLLQIALITHTLGITQYGRFSLVVAFVTIVSTFFDLRVGIAATTYGARQLRRDPRAAVGVFQLSYLIDLSSGAVFAGVVAPLTLIVGSGVVGGVSPEVVLVYTLVLLARHVETTPIAVLRLLDRMKLLALMTFVTESARLALVFAALQAEKSLLAVAAAVAVGKLGAGTVKALLAFRVFVRAYPGERLTRASIGHVPADERQAILRTVFHSSLLSYEGITQIHAPTLVLGWLAGATETGLYKVGMAIASVIGNVAAPASAAILPRLSRLWSEERYRELRRLLRQATLISLPVIVVVYLLLLAFRDPMLELLGGGPVAKAAGTVLLLGAAGQAVYAAVFWRTSVLLAAYRTGTVAKVSLAGGALQIGALIALVPSVGAEGAALAYFLSRAAINGALGYIAVRTVDSAVKAAEAAPS